MENVKEKAKKFAINAHRGQIRKSDPDKPMIIHPISVGNLLDEYGFDDNVISAGFLHDVVEDTDYTIEDINKEFGEDIARLVMCATEPNKKLSWEERKQDTIDRVKKYSLREKLVICADKINNLEDLMILFQKSGNRDFSAFKRGEDKQKWYYTSVYNSLVYGEEENFPLFKRLKNVIEIIFEGKDNSFLKEVIYKENSDYYEKLKILHAKKLELARLKNVLNNPKPYIIEFTGTPRTGKTTSINNIYDFFKKGNFSTTIVEEFTTTKEYKENTKEKLGKLSSKDRNLIILELVEKQLIRVSESKNDIILIDRSINDRQIWNNRQFIRGNISESEYDELTEKYQNLSKKMINCLVVTYTDELTSLKRDYNCNLALEERSFMNLENIKEYNDCLNSLYNLFENSVDSLIKCDTTNTDMKSVIIEITNRILDSMRTTYIEEFKQDLKKF